MQVREVVLTPELIEKVKLVFSHYNGIYPIRRCFICDEEFYFKLIEDLPFADGSCGCATGVSRPTNWENIACVMINDGKIEV